MVLSSASTLAFNSGEANCRLGVGLVWAELVRMHETAIRPMESEPYNL
jgi:hypothetical protein